MIECDGTRAEKNQAEGQSCERHRKLVTALPHQSVVEVDLGDGDGKIDADRKSGDSGEQTDQHQDTAKEFGKCGKISGPAGETEAGDELNVVMKSTENFEISVASHDGAQGQTHYQKGEGLQAIEVTQMISSGRRIHRLQEESGRGKRNTSYRGMHNRVSGVKHLLKIQLYEHLFKFRRTAYRSGTNSR